jgi:hypothetical protein
MEHTQICLISCLISIAKTIQQLASVTINWDTQWLGAGVWPLHGQ